MSETLISKLLEKSNIEQDTPFTFVRYEMEKICAHGRERTGCSSQNFSEGYSIITVNHLLSRHLGSPLKNKLENLTSDKKRIEYLAEKTKEVTGLEHFPQYLTLLFEIDAMFLNDDRHLNNIAVLEKDGKYDYCPIFDNGAGLLSDIQMSPMDIEPKGLIRSLTARPFGTTFNRQKNMAESLYGKQLVMPKFAKKEILEELEPLLEYYPERDRGL